MAGQSQDQFEFYFRRADLDGDGRISGAEAVSFLNGSGLPKQVLAQVWMHADQSRSGFLSRQEFYNALKLVTVAQSKRELTPEIVKAALYGHAAAKIPPPKINLPPTTAPQMGGVAPAASPNPGLRGPVAPSFAMGQQYIATQQSQSIRPVQAVPAVAAPLPTQGNTAFSGQPQVMPAATAAHPPQSMPSVATGSNLSNPNVSTDWLGGRTGGAPIGPQGVAPATSLPVTNPQASFAMPSQTTISNSKALVAPGDALSSNSGFGGEAFSVIPSTQKQEPSMAAYSASSTLASSAIIPTPSTVQPVAKSNALDSLQSSFSMQSTGRMQSPLNPSQHISTQSSSLIASSGISAGVVNSASTTTQLPWPKMKPSDIQKYTKVFVEVDTDRDGKIMGEQARNLFLSWRLPREVLKQVWDLSDQDNDSMLSLREFCFALYLMERFREGRPLPAALPNNIMFDETLLTMTGQPTGAYGNPAWGPNSGFGQQQGMAARAMTPSAGFRPPVPPRASHADSTTVMSHQSKAGTPVSDDPFASQLSNGEPNSLDSNAQDAAADGKKVDGTEKVILDSKEKIEFYRTKMQELVMYKSRCENRRNEITERAIADKREAEILTKKYEEKYKQVAEIASKLTIEEAKFREIQERKTELHQAIVNVEQGGSADGILQVRADRIQSDLEELMKALAERYKKHGHDIKSSAVIELPIGWHPGVPEGAALWDEEWDKFEDEGFGNELTVDVKKTSPASTQREEALPDGSLTPDSLSSEKHGSLFTANERALEVESAYTHSEDGTRSPRGSPGGRTSLESPTQQFSDGPFVKSPKTDTETHRSFDESAWGAFDNDDTDSVWGFNSKAMDSERHTDSFGWSNFGANSTRTESPSAESVFNRKSPFVFEDSVPSTPLSRFGNSSPRFSDVSRDQFDSFSRFDSFSMHDGGFSQPERLTRFDSVNSSKDFGHGFSFDDSDPFGSSGPFKVSSDNHSPKKGSDKWSSF